MTWGNFMNFHAGCQKSRKFYFDGHLLSKVYRVVQLKSVVELCVMILKNEQNLEEKWIVVSKLTWRIWWTFTWELKNSEILHFDRLFLSKKYNVSAKKL